MKVRIIKSRSKTLWYSNRIGTEWEVIKKESSTSTFGEKFYVIKNKTFGYGIFVSDCEIVHEKISLPEELFEL